MDAAASLTLAVLYDGATFRFVLLRAREGARVLSHTVTVLDVRTDIHNWFEVHFHNLRTTPLGSKIRLQRVDRTYRLASVLTPAQIGENRCSQIRSGFPTRSH